MNRSLFTFFSLTFVTMTTSMPAFAKGDRRDGFNFGTSMGLHSESNRRNALQDSEISGKTTSDVRSFSPYAGYSMAGFLNLGMTFNIENSTESSKELRTSTNTELSREINSDLKSASVFARLLFGRILYMELGAGLYHNSVKETRQEAVLDGSVFNGTREEYNSTGVGPGYHVGVGIEIPVVAGFYFTSAYKNHIYQLRELKGSSDLGEKRAHNQNSELSFGVAYYYQ